MIDINEEQLYEWLRSLQVNTVETCREIGEWGIAGYVLIICREMENELRKTEKGRQLLSNRPLYEPAA